MKWLDEDSVNAIQDGTVDLSLHMPDPEALSTLPENACFDKPDGWDEAMEDVRTLLNVPNY